VHGKAARPHSVPTTTSLIVRPPGPTPTCHHFPAAPPQRARSILSPSPPTRSLSSLLLSPSPSLSRTFSLSPPPGGRGPRVSTGHGVGSVGARTAAGVAGHGVESANAPAAASVVALGAAATLPMVEVGTVAWCLPAALAVPTASSPSSAAADRRLQPHTASTLPDLVNTDPDLVATTLVHLPRWRQPRSDPDPSDRARAHGGRQEAVRRLIFRSSACRPRCASSSSAATAPEVDLAFLSTPSNLPPPPSTPHAVT
jgi:hypothetical protein